MKGNISEPTEWFALPFAAQAITCAVILINTVWIIFTPITISATEVLLSLSVILLISAVAVYYARYRRDEQISALAIGAAFLLLHTNSGAVCSYLSGSIGGPAYDWLYTSIDEALGFHWLHFIGWINSQPVIIEVTRYAYHSSIIQIIFLLFVLSYTRQFEKLGEFLFAYAATSVGVILVFAIAPSLGPYHFFAPSHDLFANIDPHAARSHLADIAGLRSGDFTHIVPSKIEGIIPFPSFHTCLAILVPFALRNTPYLFWPSVLLNCVVIVGTLTEGGHYLADLLGGAALSILVIYLTPWALQKEFPNSLHTIRRSVATAQ